MCCCNHPMRWKQCKKGNMHDVPKTLKEGNMHDEPKIPNQKCTTNHLTDNPNNNMHWGRLTSEDAGGS